MMKLLKSICLTGLATAICFSGLAFRSVSVAEASERKTIDMYLIGGQSNAAGMSKHLYAVNEEFANIGYRGEVEENSLDNAAIDPDQVRFSDVVKAGLGHRKNEIGPEYGMGKALNGYYSSTNKAFIFKYAVGGTPLLGDSGRSWLSRSLWKSGHEPDISKPSAGENGVGWLYSMFLHNFEICYGELVSEGYTPVVKGMVWMQGENDLGKHVEYEPALEALIGDFRSDLAQITGDNLNEMPFVIGEIATTFQQYSNPAVPPFIEVQRAVADKMTNVKTVPTDDLIIVNEYGGVNGSDNSHFNVNDEVTLGLRFGRKLAELNGKKTVEIEEKGGVVTFDFTDPAQISFQFTSQGNRTLSEFSVNGQDELNNVQNGRFILSQPTQTTKIKAVFSSSARYKVTYEKTEHCELISAPAFVYHGDLLSVNVKADAGYEITSVKYGDAEMSFNEVTECYEIVADGADTVSVQTAKTTAQNGLRESGLEGWAIALIAVGSILAAGGIAVAIFFAVKKKRK